MNYKQITQESYNATANEFAANVINLAPLESIKSMISRLAENPQIIDIGCGSGRDAKHFSELGAIVTGIDFSEKLLEIAKNHAPQAQFLNMDIENMSFDEGTFDAAWAACSLMHIPKLSLPKVLKQIHRFLKNEGYFYLALKQGKNETFERDMRYEGNVRKFWSYYEQDELRKILIDAHFSILEFELIGRTHHYQTHDAFKILCQKA